MKIYGIKEPKLLNDSHIIKYSIQNNIPQKDSYKLDTSFKIFLFSFDSLKYSAQIKNHYQPLQALYYDNSNKLIAFYINCYAEGFPNLKWNNNNALDSFPPKQQAPVDSILSFDVQLKYLKPLFPKIESKPESIVFDYYVIIYWNHFMNRQSRRIIKSIENNCKLSGNKKVKIFYVNDDNMFVSTK